MKNESITLINEVLSNRLEVLYNSLELCSEDFLCKHAKLEFSEQYIRTKLEIEKLENAIKDFNK